MFLAMIVVNIIARANLAHSVAMITIMEVVMKKHKPRDADSTLKRVFNIMSSNSFIIADTITLLQAYQYIYYCQGVYRNSADRKHRVKYFSQIKSAFERVFDKIACSCVVNANGFHEAPANLPVKFHKVTRGKIAFFCIKYQGVYRKIYRDHHLKAVAHGREMLDYYLLIKRPEFGQFARFC